MAAEVLELKNISVEFDGFKALTNVSASIAEHEIHFFIGPNGAGKTTLLDVICGKTHPKNGRVTLCSNHKNLLELPEYRIVDQGVGRKFQTPSLFVNLTVYENMELSLKGGKGVFASLFRNIGKTERLDILRILKRIDLLDKKDEMASGLSHGKKQWLEIGMLLVQKPELLLLDEPVAGMGKQETEKTGQILREIARDCSIVVVEHDMEFVRQVADTVTVLHEGKILVEGDIETVIKNETVKDVYLGRGGEEVA